MRPRRARTQAPARRRRRLHNDKGAVVVICAAPIHARACGGRRHFLATPRYTSQLVRPELIAKSMTTRLKALRDWVAEVAELTSPDRIHWCDGTEQEYRKLLDEMLDSGTLLELNQQTYPGCYLHRSDPQDVARVEHLTFVCTRAQEDAGPNNNWKAPAEAKELMNSCFAGCMRGRTMYVIPYCMGPIDSPYARCGVEIT